MGTKKKSKKKGKKNARKPKGEEARAHPKT